MKSIFDMKGIERAAALLVALGPDAAAEIMKHLDELTIEKLSLEIAKIDRLTPEEKEDLVGNFMIDLRKDRRSVKGGEEKAMEILVDAFGRDRAEDVIKKFAFKDMDEKFEFLKDIESDIIIHLLSDEHPQAIAVTLGYLPPQKSASIIQQLPREIAKDVALRIVRMQRVAPEAAFGIARGLKAKYEKYITENPALKTSAGLDSLAEIMKHMKGDDEKKLMTYFDREAPAISGKIREMIYSFENVAALSNSDIRILIDELDDDDIISRALKGAGDKVRFKFLRNMSQNRATRILEEMDFMGAIRLSEVEDNRRKIIDVMRRLIDNGVIRLISDKDVMVE